MRRGARRTSVTAYTTLLNYQARHANSTSFGRTLQGASLFRCVSRACMSPPLLTLLYRLRTSSCTGMRSSFPSTFPGAFSRYSFVLIATRETFPSSHTRSIAPIHSDMLVRRKISCGCMRYGPADTASVSRKFTYLHSTSLPFWSASSYRFSY